MTMGGTILYGEDHRPVDAPLFEIRLRGVIIHIGFDCTGRGGCRPIPPGLAALRELLMAIDADRLASEDCSAAFPGG